MIAATEQTTFVMIPIDQIVSKLPVRRLSVSGITRIQGSIQRSGFLENYPLTVVSLGDDTYLLVDGNHRYEAATALELAVVPCVVRDEMPEEDMYRLALQSNDAAENVVPSTLVTHAEFIKHRTEEGYTQEKIAKMLGWSRSKVGDYSLLKNISAKAWTIIVGTFESIPTTGEEDAPTSFVGAPTFTETLLRSILDLEPEQQFELVQALAHPDKDKRITKGKFKTLAESYRARNEMKAYALTRLGDLGEPFTTQLLDAIYSGAYDADWKNDEHPKLHKLLAAIRDEWEQKNSIHLIHGDFYEEVKKIGDGCIDLILTDPPYNIANEREFSLDGRKNISQDFGEWDKYDHQGFIDLFGIWSKEWARLLRNGGSGYVFTSDIYLSYLREALEQEGLDVKTTIVWHKSNPAPQLQQTTFQSSVEYILFFTKGRNHTFHWLGNTGEMHNFLQSALCGGNERMTDAKGNVLHPTQKPLQVIKHLVEVSSNRGDMLLDCFAGVGTTGKASKDLGRKFIGIEQDGMFFEAMKRRLANE